MGGRRDLGTEQTKFKYWLALPSYKRKDATGYGTQKAFAEAHNVDPATLSRWKNDKAFMDDVERIRRKKLDEKLSDVYDALLREAIEEQNQSSIEFAFKLAGRYEESRKIQHEDITEDDVANMSDEAVAESLAGMLADSDTMRQAGVEEEDIESELKGFLGVDSDGSVHEGSTPSPMKDDTAATDYEPVHHPDNDEASDEASSDESDEASSEPDSNDADDDTDETADRADTDGGADRADGSGGGDADDPGQGPPADGSINGDLDKLEEELSQDEDEREINDESASEDPDPRFML